MKTFNKKKKDMMVAEIKRHHSRRTETMYHGCGRMSVSMCRTLNEAITAIEKGEGV